MPKIASTISPVLFPPVSVPAAPVHSYSSGMPASLGDSSQDASYLSLHVRFADGSIRVRPEDKPAERCAALFPPALHSVSAFDPPIRRIMIVRPDIARLTSTAEPAKQPQKVAQSPATTPKAGLSPATGGRGLDLLSNAASSCPCRSLSLPAIAQQAGPSNLPSVFAPRESASVNNLAPPRPSPGLGTANAASKGKAGHMTTVTVTNAGTLQRRQAVPVQCGARKSFLTCPELGLSLIAILLDSLRRHEMGESAVVVDPQAQQSSQQQQQPQALPQKGGLPAPMVKSNNPSVGASCNGSAAVSYRLKTMTVKIINDEVYLVPDWIVEHVQTPAATPNLLTLTQMRAGMSAPASTVPGSASASSSPAHFYRQNLTLASSRSTLPPLGSMSSSLARFAPVSAGALMSAQTALSAGSASAPPPTLQINGSGHAFVHQKMQLRPLKMLPSHRH